MHISDSKISMLFDAQPGRKVTCGAKVLVDKYSLSMHNLALFAGTTFIFMDADPRLALHHLHYMIINVDFTSDWRAAWF